MLCSALRRVLGAAVLWSALTCGVPALAEQKPVTLTLWMTDARTDYKVWLDRAAAEYKKSNPHVSVNVVQMSPNDAYVKWPAAVNAGNTPDITWMFFAFAAWINDLPGGSLAPMDDVVDALGRERFTDEGLAAWRYRDKYLGVPYTRQPFFLFWRKDRFAAAGLKPPKTWADVLEAAKALNKPERGEFGIALAGKNDWTVRQNFELVLYSNGGHLLSRDGKPAFDGEVGRHAIDIYAELFRYVPPGSLAAAYTEVNRSFSQGATAMVISLPVVLSQFLATNPDMTGQVGAVIPSDIGLSMTMQNNKGWSVFERSPNVDEAKKFVQFLYTTEQYAAALEAAAFGWMPLYEDKAAIDRFFGRSPVTKAFPDAVPALLENRNGYYAGIDWFGQNPNGGVVGSKGVLERNLNIHLARRRTSAETARQIQQELAEIFKP